LEIERVLGGQWQIEKAEQGKGVCGNAVVVETRLRLVLSPATTKKKTMADYCNGDGNNNNKSTSFAAPIGGNLGMRLGMKVKRR
jgi:hypothetical protein